MAPTTPDMKDLLSRLRAGETVTFSLACGNELTLSPYIINQKLTGIYVASVDDMPFAETSDIGFSTPHSLSQPPAMKRHLRFFMAVEAFPGLLMLARTLVQVNRKPKEKEPKQKLYVRLSSVASGSGGRYWVCTRSGGDKRRMIDNNIYFREGEKTLYNCAPTWFYTEGEARLAVRRQGFAVCEEVLPG